MKVLGAIMFPEFELLDLCGPLEMFGLIPKSVEIRTIAENNGPISCRQGPKFLSDDTFSDNVHYDIILVPGGPGTRKELDNPLLIDFVKRVSANANLITSVCTGSVLLAKAGLLDDVAATTNKAAFNWVKEQRPRVKWQTKARWVEDRSFLTSSGVSAGMDMSLAAIAKLFGEEAARDVAIRAEYEWHDNPNWDPFAEINGLC